MIDASQMPRVPSEVLQQEQQAAGYVRAPAVPGGLSGPVRPEVSQRNDR